MTSTKELFKELIEFCQNCVIQERQYVHDDGDQDPERLIRASLNGLYSAETLKIHIDCLFQRGFTRFKSKARHILKDEGIGKLQAKMYSMSGELTGLCVSVEPKTISYPSISFMEIKEGLNSQDYEVWKNSILRGDSTLELTNAYNIFLDEAINNLPGRSKELILEFSHELKKIEFKVDSNFLRDHGKKIYDELIESGEMEANIEDFLSFCKGEKPLEKVKFKHASGLGTFIKLLKDNKVLKTGRFFWSFLADYACTSFDGDFKVNNLKSNRGASRNRAVTKILQNILS